MSGGNCARRLRDRHERSLTHLARFFQKCRAGFFHHFPKPVRVYSCSVGASKPDPLIFREALRACKVNADQAVYIDDIAAYADAARALGCCAIQFHSPEQLLQDLGSLGVTLG